MVFSLVGVSKDYSLDVVCGRVWSTGSRVWGP